VNLELKAAGWLPLRVWECQVKSNPDQVARAILKIVRQRQRALER
jgi:very-short-patch-repair endonuclease